MSFQLKEWHLIPAKYKQYKSGQFPVILQMYDSSPYYHRYIPHFSHIVAPLHALTQKNATFSWTEACQQAFTALKAKLVQPPVLTYPQFHSSASQFVVYTDASDVGLGVPF